MEKDIFNINKNQLSYGRGYVYSLQYHLVWCTKYRKKVLKDGIDLECKKMLQDLAEEYRFQILAMEVMPDHIHMFVDCRPQFYISDMIKIIGMGGIATAEDALEFIMAGATAVSVGTANFINPATTLEVVDGIKAYMERHQINDINELIGCVK